MDYPFNNRFMYERFDILITQISSFPGLHSQAILKNFTKYPPILFIYRLTRILKVIYDKKLNLLHMNARAADISSFYQLRTLLGFVIDGDKIKDLKDIEIGKN